jgi:hypothetical protein
VRWGAYFPASDSIFKPLISGSPRRLSAVIVRLDRTTQYPEAAVLEPSGRGVLDAPLSRSMTAEGDVTCRSRGTKCPRCSSKLPSKIQRVQGMPDARCTRSRLCSKESTGVSNYRYAAIFRHSLRNGFNGFLRALPGDRALLPPSCADRSAHLAPASGRQNHTISPSAQTPFVAQTNCARRCASIASRSQRP